MNIYQTAKKFRRELLKRERAAASSMVSAYGHSWTAIKGKLDALTAQIEEARAAGVEVSQAWLLRQERYQELMTQVEQEIGQYARFADENIRTQQREAIAAAAANAKQLAFAGLDNRPESAMIMARWNQVPTSALTHLVGTFADGSPLFSLLGELGPHAAEATKKALLVGLATGQNPRQIASQVRNEAGLGLVRSLTIARTETLRSYRSASLENYRANEDVVKGWIWTAALSSRTCAMCLAMSGTKHPLDEEFGSHPNCRCCPVPETATFAELGIEGMEDDEPPPMQSGADWFAEQDEAKQKQILGPGKFAAYQDGKIGLGDLVGEKDDPKWGPQRYERSLSAALASG